MSTFLTDVDKAKMLLEAADPEKVTLVCSQHHFVYNPRSKRPPVFECKQCMMVAFVGLIASIPPNRRDEVREMLEYSVHKLIEADKNGMIDRIKLFARPEVSVQKGN
jgi:hypothetical protein